VSTSLGGDVLAYRFQGGFRLMFWKEEEAVPGELQILAGYRRWGFTVANASGTAVAPTSKVYGGLEFGLGLSIPVLERIIIQARGSRLMGASLTESPGTSGASADNVVWEFEGGGQYRLSGQSLISAGVRVFSATSTFTGAGTRATSGLSTTLGSSMFYAGYTQKF